MFKPHSRQKLRVKIKSLAEEARIIRFEEKKTHNDETRESLYLHRIFVVRNEARAALLAYGYMRGLPLYKIEPKAEEDWNRAKCFERARVIVYKYGTKEAHAGFIEWACSSKGTAAGFQSSV